MSTHVAHPLDYPVWTALTTTQRALAEGGTLARRYPVAAAPFAALAQMSAECFAALDALMAPRDIAVLFTPDAVSAPDTFKVRLAETGEQMIGTPVDVPVRGVEIATLGIDDVPAMMELTELTKPGPFGVRTHELGSFLWIRVADQLVAMAGERMKPGNYTEITALACTHPIAAAATAGCCYRRSQSGSCRAAKFSSCTCFRATSQPSRCIGGKAWKRVAASISQC
jgi:hypothetical protein